MMHCPITQMVMKAIRITVPVMCFPFEVSRQRFLAAAGDALRDLSQGVPLR